MVASRISLNESFAGMVFQKADFPAEMPLPMKPISGPWNPAEQMGGWAIVPVYMLEADLKSASFAVLDYQGRLSQFSLTAAQAEEIYKEILGFGRNPVLDWNRQQLCDGLGYKPKAEEEYVPALHAVMV